MGVKGNNPHAASAWRMVTTREALRLAMRGESEAARAMFVRVAASHPNAGAWLLRCWCEDCGMTLREFSDRLGHDRPQIDTWLRGGVRPVMRTRLEIETVTSGAVPFGAWDIPADRPPWEL